MLNLNDEIRDLLEVIEDGVKDSTMRAKLTSEVIACTSIDDVSKIYALLISRDLVSRSQYL